VSDIETISQEEKNKEIVAMIMAGDRRGGEALYESFHRGMRFIASRYCPQHADDCVHDTVIEVIQQIQKGQINDAAALHGYIRTILKRNCFDKSSQTARQHGRGGDPEAVLQITADTRANAQVELERQERAAAMQRGLRRLNPRQREVLKRFYLDEQTAEVICADMELTATQFRLLKSRSKQALEHTVRKGMSSPSPRSNITNARAS
jgi:RNA polymerase sigma-70 factor, ECF subfamily